MKSRSRDGLAAKGQLLNILHFVLNMSSSLKERSTENGRRVVLGCICVFLAHKCFGFFVRQVGKNPWEKE